MSAVNFVDYPERCINCESENITSQSGFDVEIDDQDREVLVCGYKCYDCGERFHGYVLNVREVGVYSITLNITAPVEDGSPESWDWPTLIDVQPEDVSVVSCSFDGYEERVG